MSWTAQTAAAQLDVGARLQIQESMYAPGYARPPYKVGDSFNIQGSGIFGVSAQIAESQPKQLKIRLNNGDVLTLQPTPSNRSPSHISSSIPSEDWTVMEKESGSADES